MEEKEKQIGFRIKFLSRKSAKRNFCGMTSIGKKINGIPAFAGMTAAFFAMVLLSACTQQEATISAKQALINTCKSMRNCTVNETEYEGTR